MEKIKRYDPIDYDSGMSIYKDGRFVSFLDYEFIVKAERKALLKKLNELKESKNPLLFVFKLNEIITELEKGTNAI
jgi:hypothetical protein